MRCIERPEVLQVRFTKLRLNSFLDAGMIIDLSQFRFKRFSVFNNPFRHGLSLVTVNAMLGPLLSEDGIPV